MTPVVVTWHDAKSVASAAWVTIDEMEFGPRVVRTCGWEIAGVEDDHIVVAQSFDERADRWDHVVSIPWAMVRSVVRL